ncbi:hypothetical protein D3C84_1197570 [compost metagenome]
MGEVTDFGARVISISWFAPSRAAKPRVRPTVMVPPTSRAMVTGQNSWRMRGRFCCSGTARATVAVPSSSQSMLDSWR